MESSDKFSEFNAFVESIKAQIPIDELYTELTGERFVRVDGRPRAKITWREDKTPSLCYRAKDNLLSDFTDKNPNSDKDGIHYNVLDILMKCGGAISFSDALRMACERAHVAIPDKFLKKRGNANFDLPINLGKKLIEAWEACKKNMEFFIKNPNKRPANMIKFFNDRSIPFDLDFIQTVNIGICPDRKTMNEIFKDSGIFEEKDVNIFRYELEDNGLVFPLYNIDGGLCGLRFRQFDVKNFAQWLPTKTGCFFNGQRFNKRLFNKSVMVVEGEMNLVAYAIAGYKAAKEMGETDIKGELEKSLNMIFATGPRGTDVSFFKGKLRKVKYIQDHDLDDYETTPHPNDHKILETCTRVSKGIQAPELLVVDWGEFEYVNKKYDLEDFLRYHQYDIRSLSYLKEKYISFPRYAFKVVKYYLDTIDNEDLRQENQSRLMVDVANNLDEYQRQSFESICKKEFKVSDEFSKMFDAAIRPVKCAGYKINKLGQIIKEVVNEQTHNVDEYKQTNFHLRISNEIISYGLKNSMTKFYEIEIVINGQDIYKGEMPAEDVHKDDKLKSFCSETASFTDLIYYDEHIRGKGFSMVTALMQNTPEHKKTVYFSSLGRPMEDKLQTWLGTEKFCLFPKVSVINGQIVENKIYNVCLADRKDPEQPLFEFSILDDEQFRKAGKLFWYDLRNVHDSALVDTFISLAFESCTRELQGYGIVENNHGFPVYIEGQSGSYKTTAAVAAMSLLGKFKEQNDVLAWNSTTQYITNQLVHSGNIMHMLDDLKVEDLRTKEFVDFFHAIYGGVSRGRMKSNGVESTGANKLKCNVIITAEGKPADLTESIAARMLVLRIVKPSEERRIEYGKHLDTLLKYYTDGEPNINLMHGFMPRMIAWAQDRGIEPYATALDKYHKLYETIVEPCQNNAERPADMIARLVAAFDQIVTFCKEKEICTEAEGDTALRNLIIFWKIKIKDQMKRINSQSSAYKVVDNLCQLIFAEGIGIKVYKDNRWIESKVRRLSVPIYDITYPNEGRKLLLVYPGAIIAAMNNYTEGGYTIIKDKFLLDLKEKGIIETDKDGKCIHYPIPDEKTGRIGKNVSSIDAIDYNTLIKTYEESRRD